MHELSIAMALVEQIQTVAADHRMACVTEVELETGSLRQVVPEIMQMSFQEAARGTPADGARLVITEIDALAECHHCGISFTPNPHDYLCPHCDTADVKVIQGNDIILKSVACDECVLH